MARKASASKMNVSNEVMISMQAVNKWYGTFHVLRDINLTVHKGERIVICGHSGSGKSTLIRCLNRLEEHQDGTINVQGIEINNDLKNIDEIRRDVGMVFQHFNLFPHLTILENCTLAPIWVRKMPKAQAEEIAMEYLTRVKIPEQALKYPGQLSGGQQQRVAIARSLCMEPKLMLFDEAGFDMGVPAVTTCGSGVTAAGLTLALAILGKTDIRLFDGSWSEWGASDAPIE